MQFKKLTYENQSYFFKQTFYTMEPCIFDPDYFLYDFVKKLARKNCKEIIYISKFKDAALYRETGAWGFWVKGIIDGNSEQINDKRTFLFDPKHLVCWK